jgi:hypothetical protein
MLFGNRRRRTLMDRPHGIPVFQPRAEALEAKIVLTIPLGGNAAGVLPGIAQAPFGISEVSASTTTDPGAGYSVADIADVAGTGYDSLLIGAPTVTGSPPTTVGSGNGTVYLVFGSAYTTSSSATNIQNWLNTTAGPNLTNTDRVGSLSQLINGATQTNPILTTSTPLNFPFSGVTFTGIPSLGASVAGVTLSSGTNGILIGAPNAGSGNGEAFLISGSFTLYSGKTVDLSNPASMYPGLNIVEFTNTTTPGAGGALGFSVAGGSNILGDGAGDVILGAPKASVAPTTPTNPVPQLTGVVYVISSSALSGGSQVLDLSTLLSAQTIAFAGASPGDEAGYSVADGGNVNGASGNVDDLLIGAPGANGDSGSAYLVYGGSNLANLRTIVNGIPFISLSNISGGSGTGTTVPGALFIGPTSAAGNSELGFDVAAGGDFNDDGFGDILLGAPGFGSGSTVNGQGEAFLFYGASSTNGGYLSGLIDLNNLSANFSPLILQGGDGGDTAGYSMSEIGVINPGQPTSILIGAPGYNGDSGTAYLIPGRANFSGTYSLSTTEGTSGLQGLQFTNTTPGSSVSPPFFGASVSGRLQGTQTNTVDLDDEADFIIGSPGYDYTQTAANALQGAASIVESGFLTVPIPAVNTVTVPIGVNTPNPPFSINATTPANLNIFVYGSQATTPFFMPVTDIDTTTVKVNGVAFPGATLVQDPDTDNYKFGIPDAIITISPRSLLNLSNGTQTITITGQTLAGSQLAGFTWTGTATVTVTGGSSTPVVTSVGAPATGPVLATTFVSTFGANQYTPSLSSLSALNYQPIPLSVALNEYLPTPGFRARMYLFNHPNKKIKANRGQNTGRASGINTLSAHVFSRSRFHAQKNYAWTHKTAKVGNVSGVVPLQLRKEAFKDDLIH